MLDLATEKPIPLSEASRHPLLRQGRRQGRPIHRATLERWRTRGVRGTQGDTVILETIKIGAGIRATSEEAIRRFFARVNGESPAATLTPSQAKRQHDAAEHELAAAGM